MKDDQVIVVEIWDLEKAPKEELLRLLVDFSDMVNESLDRIDALEQHVVGAAAGLELIFSNLRSDPDLETFQATMNEIRNGGADVLIDTMLDAAGEEAVSRWLPFYTDHYMRLRESYRDGL